MIIIYKNSSILHYYKNNFNLLSSKWKNFTLHPEGETIWQIRTRRVISINLQQGPKLHLYPSLCYLGWRKRDRWSVIQIYESDSSFTIASVIEHREQETFSSLYLLVMNSYKIPFSTYVGIGTSKVSEVRGSQTPPYVSATCWGSFLGRADRESLQTLKQEWMYSLWIM